MKGGDRKTPTDDPKRKARPHRSLVRLELRCRRRVIPSSFLVDNGASAARLRLEHPVEDDRGYAEADRGPELRHRLEQRTRDTLLARQRYLGDEHRPRRKREIRAQHDEACGGEARDPVRRGRVDRGKVDIRTSR